MTETLTPQAIADLAALANRMTYHRAKAEAMGFKFKRIALEKSPWDGGKFLHLRCVFTCVCGAVEELNQALPEFVGGNILREFTDVARVLWNHGSFSRAHLIADGYTEEQVDEIEAKGKAFDDECRAELLRSEA